LQIRFGATEWVVKRRFRQFLYLSEELQDLMTGVFLHSSIETALQLNSNLQSTLNSLSSFTVCPSLTLPPCHVFQECLATHLLTCPRAFPACSCLPHLIGSVIFFLSHHSRTERVLKDRCSQLERLLSAYLSHVAGCCFCDSESYFCF
jgi:hypothetical protein